MRNKKLIEQVQERAWDNRNGLYVPRTEGDIRSNWPKCGTCNREVEAVELKNQNSFGVELWARCHGKEDYYKVVYPYRITDDDMAADQIRVAMNAFMPFQISMA